MLWIFKTSLILGTHILGLGLMAVYLTHCDTDAWFGLGLVGTISRILFLRDQFTSLGNRYICYGSSKHLILAIHILYTNN